MKFEIQDLKLEIRLMLLHHINLHHVRPVAFMDRHACKADKDIPGLHVTISL